VVNRNRSRTDDGQSQHAPIQSSPTDDSIQDLELADDTAAKVTGGDATSLNFSTVQVQYSAK
jgi:hypothetical protein